ncbi:transcription factor HES-7.1-B-like [Syngnathoides biaculeatus]|uniref:transcription factor HES-7.1-B-like n=1 Tax=Syngnathoides biaculeatus TaxID=300417 RepID=UPI002ADD7265|nr:transcription factor HES-7.1-B-like [Syngnathoides biaculeatus]
MNTPQCCHRKSLKPQVERRRRERINRSLENLKTLLLAPQGSGGRRLEKAEILERTVVFLQQHADNVDGKQELPSYQRGFSSCLQRAAHFLQTEPKGLPDSSASSPTASPPPSSSWTPGSIPALQKMPSTAGVLWRPWS